MPDSVPQARPDPIDPPVRSVLDALHEVYDLRACGRYGLSEVNPCDHVVQAGAHARMQKLCAVEPGYAARLTRDSVESLALQGGPMSEAERACFERMPYWCDAVTQRQLDELAKDPQGPLPPFAGFRDEIVEALRGG